MAFGLRAADLPPHRRDLYGLNAVKCIYVVDLIIPMRYQRLPVENDKALQISELAFGQSGRPTGKELDRLVNAQRIEFLEWSFHFQVTQLVPLVDIDGNPNAIGQTCLPWREVGHFKKLVFRNFDLDWLPVFQGSSFHFRAVHSGPVPELVQSCTKLRQSDFAPRPRPIHRNVGRHVDFLADTWDKKRRRSQRKLYKYKTAAHPLGNASGIRSSSRPYLHVMFRK